MFRNKLFVFKFFSRTCVELNFSLSSVAVFPISSQFHQFRIKKILMRTEAASQFDLRANLISLLFFEITPVFSFPPFLAAP